MERSKKRILHQQGPKNHASKIIHVFEKKKFPSNKFIMLSSYKMTIDLIIDQMMVRYYHVEIHVFLIK